MIEFGLHNNVPVMAGTNTAEGAPFAGDIIWDPSLLNRLNDDNIWKIEGPERVLFRTPALNGSDWEPCDPYIAEMTRRFYFNETFSASKIQDWVNLISDSSIIRTTHQTLQWLAQNQVKMEKKKLYQYVLSFHDETSSTYFPRAFELGVGVPHGNDVYYLFYVPGAEYWSQTNLDISRRMCAMWANFAKYLDPTPENIDSDGILENFLWEDIVQSEGKVLNIGEKLKMEENAELQHRMEFWKEIEEAC